MVLTAPQDGYSAQVRTIDQVGPGRDRNRDRNGSCSTYGDRRRGARGRAGDSKARSSQQACGKVFTIVSVERGVSVIETTAAKSTLAGRSLVAGNPTAETGSKFHGYSPVDGQQLEPAFFAASIEDVDRAV